MSLVLQCASGAGNVHDSYDNDDCVCVLEERSEMFVALEHDAGTAEEGD